MTLQRVPVMPITKKQFTIEGLHCGCCAISVGMILRTVKGVSSAHADFDTKTAEIEYDDALASIGAINQAIAGLGCRLKESRK